MQNWPRTDLHIHATRYRTDGAREDMTVANIVRRCEELSLSVVGVVEHLSPHPKHPMSCLADLVAEFRTVSSPLAIFAGSEIDVLDAEGSLCAPDDVKERLGLDFVLAAVHAMPSTVRTVEDYIAEHHRRTLAVIERVPYVDTMAHPWVYARRMADKHGEAWSFARIPQTQQREIIQAAVEHHVAIEVNSKAQPDFADPAYRDFLIRARDAGVRFTVGSDAHDMDRIGRSFPVDEFLTQLGFTPDHVWTP